MVTVGSLHAGDAPNVIPGRAELTGTMRSFDPGVRARLPELIEEIARGVCLAHGADYELDFQFGYRPVVNDERATQLVRAAVDRSELVDLTPIMGGDDFSAYLAEAPGLLRVHRRRRRVPAPPSALPDRRAGARDRHAPPRPGRAPSPRGDRMTEHFAVAVGDDVLADLKRRLEATRWPDEAPDAVPDHGFGLAAARELAQYWLDGYDWKAAEATLNGFEQGKAEGVHFIADGDGPPLLLLHGWPSSVWEFVRLLPLLREHARVIVPSLPGYGFSFTPGGKRSSIVECADQIHALMGALGHERYHVAGGDWGASIAVRLAHAYPKAVRALHLYMMPLRRPRPGRSPSSSRVRR